jgi:hypothetical protein
MTDVKPPSSADADPALVAATSRAAQMLLATTAAGASGPPQAPSDGLPLVPASSSIAPNSRYADVGIAVTRTPEGRDVVHLRRRFVPQPERLATAGWDAVSDGDRIDLLAARALGDPTAFWQLCDANLAFDPAELETPGRVVRVALPEGFPGVGPEVVGA